jgi:hypothetical protein
MLGKLGVFQGGVKFRLAAVLVVVMALLSVASVARANTVGMQFIGAAGSTTLNISDPTAGYTNANALIDPYTAYINGSSTPTLIWCVDPDHGVSPGQTWTANVTYLGGNLSNTYQGSGGATAYGAMAWLITQMQTATTATQRQELQAAIWEIAEGAPGPTSGFSVNNVSAAFINAVATDITNAENNILTSGFEILTDTQGQTQEFMIINTPEPSTLFLLGAGLFAFVMLNRSKRALALIG